MATPKPGYLPQCRVLVTICVCAHSTFLFVQHECKHLIYYCARSTRFDQRPFGQLTWTIYSMPCVHLYYVIVGFLLIERWYLLIVSAIRAEQYGWPPVIRHSAAVAKIVPVVFCSLAACCSLFDREKGFTLLSPFWDAEVRRVKIDSRTSYENWPYSNSERAKYTSEYFRSLISNVTFSLLLMSKNVSSLVFIRITITEFAEFVSSIN